MVIIRSERFKNEDIYIDYPYEDIMFRWDHIDKLIYKKFYCQKEYPEPVPHDSELYNEARRFGKEITREQYIKGK